MAQAGFKVKRSSYLNTKLREQVCCAMPGLTVCLHVLCLDELLGVLSRLVGGRLRITLHLHIINT